MDVTRFTAHYDVRVLTDSDVNEILEMCRQNMLFYDYTEARPTAGEVRKNMRITPRGIGLSDKYFVGFYEGKDLVAIMDLIDGYPRPEVVYIGFFMLSRKYQGKNVGSAIVGEVMDYLRMIGKTAVRLAIDKGNPQSTHFWHKNGFEIVSEADVNGWTKLIAEISLL